MSKKTTLAAKATTNGKHERPAPPDQPKIALPEPLSEDDKQKLKLWLDKGGSFKVAATPMSRKRKRDAHALQVQDDLFEARLSVQYEVRPKDKWEKLRKYKKFTVGSESISVGQCILVKCDESQAADAKLDLQREWKAKVLEVRALDSEHVYVRVAWLNRPEDLASGRKEYHGRYELIPTNQMDIIDAMAVNGTFDITKWDDSDDNEAIVNDEQYFWRQTYDHVDTKAFSKLRIICVDNVPPNPDEMIIQCSNEDCRKWLHIKCIAESAVSEVGTYSDKICTQSSGAKITDSPKAGDASPKKKKKSRAADADIDTTSSAVAKAIKGPVIAEVFVKGQPNGPSSVAATKTEIVITDADGEQKAKEMCCLHCGKIIVDDD